jgi:hypothetical protein
MTQLSKKIDLNENEELRVHIKHLHGRSFVDLRVWAAPKTGETKWPTGKGVLIPAARWPEFKRLMGDLGPAIEGAALHE